MQNRSLPKLFLLTVCTLGLYEFVWLSQTGAEMAAKYGIHPPKVRKLLLLSAGITLSSLSILIIFVHFIPQYNKQSDSIHMPSPQCMLSYGADSGQASTSKLTQSCKQAVDTYYADQNSTENHTSYALGIAVLCIITLSVATYYYYRWYSSYASAATQVLTGTVASTNIRLGMYNAPVLTMLAIQNAFNHDQDGQAPQFKSVAAYGIISCILAFLAGLIIYFLFIA